MFKKWIRILKIMIKKNLLKVILLDKQLNKVIDFMFSIIVNQSIKFKYSRF